MSYIFISYSKKDIVFARHLRDLLEAENFEIWMDQTHLIPSEQWWTTIEASIRSCSAFIVIMSTEAKRSPWVEREILVAEEQNVSKPIFPVLLNGQRWSRLANMQYEDMTDGVNATLTPQFIKGLERHASRNADRASQLQMTQPISEPQIQLQTDNKPLYERPTMLLIMFVLLVLTCGFLWMLANWQDSPFVATTQVPSTPPGFSSNSQVTANEQWQPYIDHYTQTFEGIEMVLVPVGCFDMGNDPDAWNGSFAGVTDGDRQCFDMPFWIGRYEITNEQYGSSGYFTGEQRPRESITWYEARDFCISRAMRLPTEAEWEYVARGPDNLLYSWGNEFYVARSIWNRNEEQGTADVGSAPNGISWVGAYDLAGNVWEWTSTIFGDYPYRAGDGREMDHLRNPPGTLRTIRGGSWYRTSRAAAYLHAAARNLSPSDQGNQNVGFRCARDFDPADL